MKILAIESSCDETAAAVIENGTKILSNVVVSQVDIFAAYGGVIPEVAARSHLEAILPVIHQALIEAGITKYSTNFLAKNPNLAAKLPGNHPTTSKNANETKKHANINSINKPSPINNNAATTDIDAIAVTHTPGLMGSLMIGTLTARMLAILWHKPLYPVHHLKSHIYANWLHPNNTNTNLEMTKASRGKNVCVNSTNYSSSRPSRDTVKEKEIGITGLAENTSILEDPEPRRGKAARPCDGRRRARASKIDSISANLATPQFPLLALVISGGHTQILYMPSHNHFEIIGTTRDDAIGECFDKVAKILGLPYPGGPSIAKCAENGDPHKYPLPHPKVDGLDSSFSGLKTAVLRAVQSACGLPITTPSYELKNHLTDEMRADFAASFQDTACAILLEKLRDALEAHPKALSLVFAGGVSANHLLRQKAQNGLLSSLKTQNNHNYHTKTPAIYFPDPKFTGDNAAMVGAAAYFEIKSGTQPTDPYELDIAPRTPLS